VRAGDIGVRSLQDWASVVAPGARAGDRSSSDEGTGAGGSSSDRRADAT
jgi:hypothetical protein